MSRAMILAAGLGTRLGALSDERPKPLLPMVDIPLIRYSIALLRGHGIREIVVNLHHHGELIEQELGDGTGLGVNVVYSHEEDKLLGTGGGIRRALALLGPEPFVVINGKIVIDLDVDALLARHRSSGARATLVVRADTDARRWGAIEAPAEGGPIRSMLGEGGFMFTGVQVLEPTLVARLPDDGVERCIVRQGYLPWLAAGVPVHAFVLPEERYFMEHSTAERYLAGNFNLLRGEARLRFPPGPMLGVDPAADVHPEAELIPPVRVGPGATVGAYATVGPDAVIGARARVAAGVRVARSVIWPATQLAQDSDGAIVTPGQRVVPGKP